MDLDNAAKLKIFSAEHRELVKIAADWGLCTSPVAQVVAISVLPLRTQNNNPWFSIIFATQQPLPDFIAPHWRWLNMASDSPNNPVLKPLIRHGSSRIANFFRMPVGERIAALHERGLLNSDDVHQLVSANHQLQVNVADKMIETGRFWPAHGCGAEFSDQQPRLRDPPSCRGTVIVAGLSGAARLARLGGGYESAPVTPILIGQVQSVIESDPEAAMQALLDHKEDILSLANSLHPKMVARGGGG